MLRPSERAGLRGPAPPAHSQGLKQTAPMMSGRSQEGTSASALLGSGGAERRRPRSVAAQTFIGLRQLYECRTTPTDPGPLADAARFFCGVSRDSDTPARRKGRYVVSSSADRLCAPRALRPPAAGRAQACARRARPASAACERGRPRRPAAHARPLHLGHRAAGLLVCCGAEAGQAGALKAMKTEHGHKVVDKVTIDQLIGGARSSSRCCGRRRLDPLEGIRSAATHPRAAGEAAVGRAGERAS